MLLSPSEVDEICSDSGFSYWPRAIGNPRQSFIHAPEEAYTAFRKWDGTHSCFISTAGYDDLAFEHGGKQTPRSIIYETTFFDFDHETKPENAFADAQRLSQYLSELDIAHWVQYSGSKGYHLFMLHKPTKFRFDYRDGSSDALKNLVNQVQTHLKQTLGLNTLDEQTTGDPKRLCRFPFTKHISRDGVCSGRHAVPVTGDLSTISHDTVVESSYRPRYAKIPIPGNRLLLKETISLLDIKLHKPETQLRPVIEGVLEVESGAEASRFLASLEIKCPGVVNELKKRNPPHKARVHSAMFAKTIGMSLPVFDSVWVEMGNAVGYVDLHNHDHRRYQMSTIFDNPRYRAVANCHTLKADGCCIGDVCPKYKHAFETPTGRLIKRKWKKK